MQLADLVRMANQICDFFAGYPHAEAVTGTAAHIRAFWEPRMRRALYAHIAAGGAGLQPLMLEAIASLAGKDSVLSDAVPAPSPRS